MLLWFARGVANPTRMRYDGMIETLAADRTDPPPGKLLLQRWRISVALTSRLATKNIAVGCQTIFVFDVVIPGCLPSRVNGTQILAGA
jgi:hypothetical protein